MPETEIAATMGYLTRALKTPTIGRVRYPIVAAIVVPHRVV